MKTTTYLSLMMAWAGTLGVVAAAEMAKGAPLLVAENGGRVEARRGADLLLGWQRELLAKPAGGDKFAASAFLHPLCTPSGFGCTTIQPADHRHHFGLWWPWKFIEVEGQRHNVWEIQEGQGALVAREAKLLEQSPRKLVWELRNEVLVRKAGAEPRVAIHETATVAFSAADDANVVDIAVDQRPADKPVTIVDYRYSGFSWRGPQSWNKDNSKMTTSEGHHRDNANHQAARWVVVSGPTPAGKASVVLMSAAQDLAKTQELLRVWDSKSQNGEPFVNFNPVVKQAMPLDAAHPAVSKRAYRVLLVDREIDAAAAEAEWRKWRGK
jgi:hypothetical protein